MRLAQKLHGEQEMEANRIEFYARFAKIEKGREMAKIGIETKQYEFECPCGHIWIDSQNTGCPMCSEEVGITVNPYEIPQPKNFSEI